MLLSGNLNFLLDGQSILGLFFKDFSEDSLKNAGADYTFKYILFK